MTEKKQEQQQKQKQILRFAQDDKVVLSDEAALDGEAVLLSAFLAGMALRMAAAYFSGSGQRCISGVQVTWTVSPSASRTAGVVSVLGLLVLARSMR